MQSSGASLFTLFLAQRPETIAVIDLWDGVVAPDLSKVQKDVIVKCVVAPVIPLEKHVASFKPDVKILFLRSKASNVESLSEKSYRNDGGRMEDKFAQLDNHMQQKDAFDYVINYEDFLNDRSKVLATLGGLAAPEYYEFKRTKQDILDFNRTHSEWCRKYYRRQWSFGNIHFERDGTVQLTSGKRQPRKPTIIKRLKKLLTS
jgi:hypothetical protein